MSRQLHCFNLFRPLLFGDNATSGGQGWAYPLSYALNGQTPGQSVAEQSWANIDHSKNRTATKKKNLFLPCCVLSPTEKLSHGTDFHPQVVPPQPAEALSSSSSPLFTCALETRMARRNNFIPAPSAGRAEGPDTSH